ncbi:MAG: hypothetical protein TU35_006310 [Thermoproteus sp. AZ2]|jgi:flagellar biosynthesis component FlhA|uniref:Uncharacterized protein n=1 Tax=Thermoproteus sp. AZ2 TaxID=1609232 RepID=A0ACC6V1M6_9CREN|nr:MAG: hypothetical protein TU35_06745 [Thermoproteus sp. AZ2]
MHIEVRDQSIVERLRRLLPRPDAPFDDALRMLLEQPCKVRLIDVAREAVNELVNDKRFQEALAKVVKEAVAQQLPEVLKELKPELLSESYEGGWDAVISQALKRPDKCLTFSEVRKYYGKNLNSVMLRRRGFVQKERGIWCYTGEGAEEAAAEA